MINPSIEGSMTIWNHSFSFGLLHLLQNVCALNPNITIWIPKLMFKFLQPSKLTANVMPLLDGNECSFWHSLSLSGKHYETLYHWRNKREWWKISHNSESSVQNFMNFTNFTQNWSLIHGTYIYAYITDFHDWSCPPRNWVNLTILDKKLRPLYKNIADIVDLRNPRWSRSIYETTHTWGLNLILTLLLQIVLPSCRN